MGDEYNRDLCEERHKNVDRNITDMRSEMNDKFETLFGRLNWFYLLAIGTMATCIGSLAVALIVITGNTPF